MDRNISLTITTEADDFKRLVFIDNDTGDTRGFTINMKDISLRKKKELGNYLYSLLLDPAEM